MAGGWREGVGDFTYGEGEGEFTLEREREREEAVSFLSLRTMENGEKKRGKKITSGTGVRGWRIFYSVLTILIFN